MDDIELCNNETPDKKRNGERERKREKETFGPSEYQFKQNIIELYETFLE